MDQDSSRRCINIEIESRLNQNIEVNNGVYKEEMNL